MGDNWENALNGLLQICNNAVLINLPGGRAQGLTKEDFVGIENCAAAIRMAINNRDTEIADLKQRLQQKPEVVDGN